MSASETDVNQAISSPQPLTPMMKQWFDLKTKAGNSLLFFRLGDFYELFEEDAVTAAPVLGVTLTSRGSRGSGPTSPLCGVPVSTVENYLTKALDQGFRVALAEQMEVPGAGKTIVKRDIVQWFTPGIRLLKFDDRPHYAAVIAGNKSAWAFAAADVGTGHLVLESGQTLEALQDLIDRLPVEDLRFEEKSLLLKCKFSENIFLESLPNAERHITQALRLSTLQDAGTKSKLETQALGTLFKVLADAHPQEKLSYCRPRLQSSQVWLSSATRKNLHLIEPAEKNIFTLLDRTQTAIGRRELKQVLLNPTQDVDLITERQALLGYFKANASVRKLFRSRLSGIHDIFRLLRKRRGPYELFQISNSLHLGLSSSVLLSGAAHKEIKTFQELSSALTSLSEELQKSLQMSEDPDIGWIAPNVSATLDELRNLKANSNQLLANLEETLRTETKISSLKVKFHQVFGYVFEVTASHKEKVPPSAKRIQTLANAERFKTPELEKLEEKILSLDGRLREAEKAELNRLYGLIENSHARMLDWAEQLGTLDCFQSLADVSADLQWTTPKTNQTSVSTLRINRGTHPLASQFVPLSFDLDSNELSVLLLTGPNMSGKSTLLRLAALISLLHQIGSDVPAESAELSIFDRIACRMGAHDDMTSGQSTFFVEMREVASMLFGATEKSLLLFDEIGRGTSTFDGMSLAWAITEEVHEIGALSFMATHYLELAELERTLPKLKSFHLGVEEVDGKLVFTRSLRVGPASRSYGIHVARLADISNSILSRAEQKLHQFEKKRSRPVSLFEMMQSESD